MDAIIQLPAPVRHLVLVLLAAGLSWAGTAGVDLLEDIPGHGAVLAAVLTAVLAVFTPLVTSYGVGAARARQLDRLR